MQVTGRLLVFLICAAAIIIPPVTVPAAGGLVSGHEQSSDSVPVHKYEVIHTYPHDKSAYTQGLIWHQGFLYESAGKYQHSSLRKVELETGRVLQTIPVPPDFFAEGLTLLNGRLHQLTWREQVGFIYDLNGFSKIGEFRYSGEGWGLTNDGRSLILSDGTNRIRFLNPTTFRIERSIQVLAGNGTSQPLRQINELEYIQGEIYANVWQTDSIIRVDPKTGKLLGVIDMTGILPGKQADETDAVLNGIAYDAEKQRLFVTGKLWPNLYEIRLKPR